MFVYLLILTTNKSGFCKINFKSFVLIAFKIKMPANFEDCLMARKSSDNYAFLFHHSKLLLIAK